MKNLNLIKVMASSLIVTSVFVLNQIAASAEWKSDTTGWWYTEGSSWTTGWRLINGNWYYFYSDGYMAKNTIIDGYTIGSDGVWIQTTKNFYEELDKLPQRYNSDTAQKNGDVVRVLDIQYNIEKLDKFIENYQNKKANVGDMVRITSYTIEGGALIKELIVNNEGIKLIIDNTRDGYAAEKDRIRKEYKVVDLYKKNKNNNVICYYAKTNQGEEKALSYSDIH